MHSCYSECERSSIPLVMMILPFTHKLLKMIFFYLQQRQKRVNNSSWIKVLLQDQYHGSTLSAPGGPWCLTFAPRRLENLSFFYTNHMMGTLDFTKQFQSTGLPFIFRTAERWMLYSMWLHCHVAVPFTVQSALTDNPLSPNGDQLQFSPNNIHTLSGD